MAAILCIPVGLPRRPTGCGSKGSFQCQSSLGMRLYTLYSQCRFSSANTLETKEEEEGCAISLKNCTARRYQSGHFGTIRRHLEDRSVLAVAHDLPPRIQHGEGTGREKVHKE
ncbi:hypothetical protein M0802_002760 [Mischocyttarus mexicanus]|nr:hypothetical protein M0802_002760 [Mischocyttarus mexicanus]